MAKGKYKEKRMRARNVTQLHDSPISRTVADRLIAGGLQTLGDIDERTDEEICELAGLSDREMEEIVKNRLK